MIGTNHKVSLSTKAGCYECFGSDSKWKGKNAHGVACRHNKFTGHRVWVEKYMHITYEARTPFVGKKKRKKR